MQPFGRINQYTKSNWTNYMVLVKSSFPICFPLLIKSIDYPYHMMMWLTFRRVRVRSKGIPNNVRRLLHYPGVTLDNSFGPRLLTTWKRLKTPHRHIIIMCTAYYIHVCIERVYMRVSIGRSHSVSSTTIHLFYIDIFSFFFAVR